MPINNFNQKTVRAVGNQKIGSAVGINKQQAIPGKRNPILRILSSIMKLTATKISSGRCSGSVPWQGMLANAKLRILSQGLVCCSCCYHKVQIEGGKF